MAVQVLEVGIFYDIRGSCLYTEQLLLTPNIH